MTAQDIGIYVFIIVAGTLGTDLWRWLGVIGGKQLAEGSEALTWVRSVATALVAGVIANQVLYPGGVLATSPLGLRLLAGALGFGSFLLARKNMAIGLPVALATLAAGLYYFGVGTH